ncbi:flagellar export chaperone FliS [Nocardioidaceae bacterium]|nr:flagellar export chaperone FliS [Nocardioidaceae bacterium]
MIPNARNAYAANSIATASPGRLLVMLYDRLALDVRRAGVAQDAGDHDAARTQLLHAQEIVTELHSTLKVDLWEGGPALSGLYAYLTKRLIEANIGRDRAATAECQTIIDDLAGAWREALLTGAAGPNVPVVASA